MKKLFFLFFLCLIYQLTQAQTADHLDPEKLLNYYQAQQYAEAAQYLQDTYTDSTDVSKLKQLAYANLMAGKLPEASGFYLKVLKTDSNNFNAYKQLAKLESNLQSPSKKAYLLKANGLNPQDAEVAIQLADLYFKSNQFNKAEETLNLALSADSTNLLLLNAKMPVSMALKKYPEAIKAGKQLLAATNGPTENLLFQMALSYRGARDYKTATTYLQRAIKEGISPKIASYYGLLGDSYENLNQNKEALEVYKKGLLFENNGSLYYNIALLYEDKLNDKKNAIGYYTQYLNSIKDPEKQRRHVAYIKNKIEELKR
ncbi:MAG: tetratricopeptide repeat protein [Candidatus Pedobacter colombiensis]|uniref:Tetratricopeptide repeat protein n=1 Tax=Candidatus Pedobacter colombiensis TaxID=3121371 RepID=A0AAJ6B563_9SPHI|nr:tetratricopeptide repeat protein [Pedobacter sp.]WEK18392.1 MAG: tetratricopeptide repeat protein [Pedobacter sp.]